ncbi:hypothetical protein GCM10009524_51300 [Spirilliplanes yamanashiensis]
MSFRVRGMAIVLIRWVAGKPADRTNVARFGRRIKGALIQGSPIPRWAGRAARTYRPVILCIASL